MDGVYDEKIEIDIEKRLATVYTDKDKFDVDAALAKLDSMNFPATVQTESSAQ